MRTVEDIKLWQWALLGAIGGLCLAYAKLSMPEAPARMMTQSEFELRLRQSPQQGLSSMTDLAVRPVFGGYVITGKQLFTFQNRFGYQPFAFEAPSRFKPMRVRNGEPSMDKSLPAFLNEAVSQNPSLSFRYVWWIGSRETIFIYGIGGAILCGIIWPLALRMMVAGGLGRRNAADLYDLNQLKEKEPAETIKSPGVPIKQLDSLLENLSARGEMEIPQMVETRVSGKDTPVIMKLVASGEIKTAPQVEHDKHYSGDFYPTMAHTNEIKEPDSQ